MTRSGYQFQLFMRTPGGAVRWRLLSGNNREAGRSAVGYSDAEMCLRAIEGVQACEPAMVGRIKRAEPNKWIWELYSDQRLVAAASRPADRLIRSEGALAVFRANVTLAAIRPVVLVSEARRWHSSAR